MKKTISILLSITALFLASCQGETDSVLPPYDDTVCTEYLLSSGGKTDYSILLSTDASEYETFAAEELQSRFKEATGATMPIVTDDTVSFSETAKIISIGDNAFQKASGVTASYEEYATSGCRLVNKGASVILMGAHDQASMYAVYDFLGELFDYEYYDVDAYTLKKQKTVRLPVLDIKDIPSFDDRTFGDFAHDENFGGSAVNAWRQRLIFDEDSTAIGGHTPATLLPISTYYDEHKDWYSDNSKEWQLCYTNEEMMQEYIKRCKDYIIANPNSYLLYMTENDYNTWCQCQKCQETIHSYDLRDDNGEVILAAPNGVTGIIFKSRVADALDKWLAEEYPDRHFTYITFAYFVQRSPATYKGSDGQYHPLTNGQADDPLKKVNPNLCIQVAAIEANRNLSWEDNKSQYEELKKWAAITSNVMVYEYPQDAQNVLLPYDGLHVHADNLRVAKSLGHTAYHYQGNYNTQSAGFYNLHKYVCAKLMWDVNLDVDTLVRNYIKVCYGPASEYMLEMQTIQRTRMAKLREENNYGGHVLQNGLTAGNWPRELVLVMQDLVDKAYESIEYLQYEDPEYYEQLFRKIKIEEFTLQYISLALYRNYYSYQDKHALIDEFELYSKKYGATLYHESKPMADLIAQWRKD